MTDKKNTNDKQSTITEYDKTEQPQTIAIKDMSIQQLKIACFDLSENIKQIQNKYQACYNELVSRSQQEQ